MIAKQQREKHNKDAKEYSVESLQHEARREKRKKNITHAYLGINRIDKRTNLTKRENKIVKNERRANNGGRLYI
jgi:hypothetical protein